MATASVSFTQYCRPFPRGTLLVLVMSGLLYAAHWFVYNAIDYSFGVTLGIILDGTHYALWLLLPVTGWVAESWLGRYRAIVVGLIVSAILLLLVQIAFVMENLHWTTPGFVLTIVASFFAIFSVGSFYTNMLPFTLDQMVGAPAEELSAVVQWYYWGYNIGLLVQDSLQSVSAIVSQQLRFNILPTSLLVLGSLSLSVALVMDCLCHKWLDTHDKTENPIKLIFAVLNYARRNRCPRLRSAFTYIDEEQPSRLDFGKHKFGGPFMEEEVENVKTVFRLVPLLVSLIGATLSLEKYDQFALHSLLTNKHTFIHIQNMKHSVYYVALFVLIPVYRLLIYPFLGKYVPSMLKLTGIGLFMCSVSAVITLAIDSIGHFHNNGSHCIFDENAATGTIPIPIYWVLVINAVSGIGTFIATCSMFEFAMAQSPNQMRGIIMGLVIAMVGLGKMGSYLLNTIFRYYPTATPSCVFYYYLVLSLLMLLILVAYVVLAKRYKLRERERHINIQAIVEEHYERYFDQEEEYNRETGSIN